MDKKDIVSFGYEELLLEMVRIGRVLADDQSFRGAAGKTGRYVRD